MQVLKYASQIAVDIDIYSTLKPKGLLQLLRILPIDLQLSTATDLISSLACFLAEAVTSEPPIILASSSILPCSSSSTTLVRVRPLVTSLLTRKCASAYLAI